MLSETFSLDKVWLDNGEIIKLFGICACCPQVFHAASSCQASPSWFEVLLPGAEALTTPLSDAWAES